MPKRATRSRTDREEFWRDQIARQQHSAQSIRGFCDSHGVSQPSFYSRRRRLRLQNAQALSRFVPVQMALSAPRMHSPSIRGATLVSSLQWGRD